MPGLIAADKAARAPPVSKFDMKHPETDDNVDLDDAEKKPVEMIDTKPKEDKKEISNIMFGLRTVKGVGSEEGTILVGAEDQCITKYKFGYGDVQAVDVFKGHSMGIRSIEHNPDCTKILTGCEDHSLRTWDYTTCKPLNILSGHRDVVVSKIFHIHSILSHTYVYN